MADPVSPLNAQSIYQQQMDRYNQQIAALKQPMPQQGGFLSGADPVMLALAAGLLSPTKAGSFGESIGAGLQAVQVPLSEIQRQEQARRDKISALEDARMNMELKMLDIQSGGRSARGDDPSLIAKRNEDAASMLREEARFERDPTKKSVLLNRADAYQRAADQILERMGISSTPSEPVKTEQPAPTQKKEEAGKTTAKPYTGTTPPSAYPDAQLAEDGYWYIKGPDGRRNVRIKVKE